MEKEELRRRDAIRCIVEIFKDGQPRVFAPDGKPLERLRAEEVEKLLVGKKIKRAEITPLSTYIETESGPICLNGVWYYIP